MSPTWFPCFIDCEASGFGPTSYPIAVAWNDTDGVIHRLLIDPRSVPSWQQWDARAFAAHGLTREQLYTEGLPPAEVMRQLLLDLAGMQVFSDAPEYDGEWLRTLAAAAGVPLPFTLEHADELFIGALQQPEEMLYQTQLRLERIKATLQQTRVAQHDPGFDVGWLVQMWRSCLGEPAKMAHGIGPLPESTATGSFKKKKNV
jgi:hypothetical protein